MKVSNQVFTASNSNKCVGGLCLCRVDLVLVVSVNVLLVHGRALP